MSAGRRGRWPAAALVGSALALGPASAQELGRLGPELPAGGPPPRPGVVALAAAPASGPKAPGGVTGPWRALAGAVDGALVWAAVDGAAVEAVAAGKLPAACAAVAVGADGRGWALADDGRLFPVPAPVPAEAGAGAAQVERPGPAEAGPRPIATHPGGGLALALHPDRPFAATAGQDGAIRLWSLDPARPGEALGALEGHEGPVSALCWTPEALWSAGWDGTLRAWEVDPGKGSRARAKPRTVLPTKEVPAGVPRDLSALAATPDGGALLVGGWDGRLVLVDARRKRATRLPDRPHAEWVRAAAWSPDGRRAVAALTAEASLRFVSATAPERADARATVEVARIPAVVAWSPDGARVLVGLMDGGLAVVDAPPEPAAPARREDRP